MSLVLVTGGAGFIGSHLVEALLARSYRVRVLDNLSQGSLANLPVGHPDLEFVEGDVTDLNACRTAVVDVTGIFHLAAMSKVFPSLENPSMIDYCTQQNVHGTCNILHVARERRATIRKFVYAGSSTYYGTNPPPHSEDQLPSCQSPYALTKYVGELYCEQFSRGFALPTVRLRYFMTYGPRQPNTGAYAVVTGVFLKQWRSGDPLTILGDGSQTRDFIHVRDVAEGTVRAFESDQQDATINIGTGRSLTIKALADLISPDQVVMPKRAHDIPHQRACTNRMRRFLDWEPSIRIEDELRAILNSSPTSSISTQEVKSREAEPDGCVRPKSTLVVEPLGRERKSC